ncbi:acyltransferase [Aurantibacter sp.]|uniref:acyltransferase n=1 Tax=Aurantibacter sp. TaxID=2807103 RepID=UPI0035C80145
MKIQYRKLISFLKIYRYRNISVIGKGCHFGKYARLECDSKSTIKIGNNVMLHGRLISKFGGIIQVGDYTSIRSNVIIGAIEKITIGNNVIFSNDIIIYDNNNHPVHPNDRIKLIESGWGSKFWSWKYSSSSEVQIGNNVWIGQNSRILKGVKIGDNSIVAAGSIVTKNVPENSIVAGNPAKTVKTDLNREIKLL